MNEARYQRRDAGGGVREGTHPFIPSRGGDGPSPSSLNRWDNSSSPPLPRRGRGWVGGFRQGAWRRAGSGFTLIEIMAAMGILIIIMLMLGRIFTDSSKMWKVGTKRAFGLGEGRAVMEFLTRELSQAYADKVVTFKLRSSNLDPFKGYGAKLVYGWEVDELYFMSFIRTPSGEGFRRESHAYIYFVTNMIDSANRPIPYRYRLVRCRKTASTYNRGIQDGKINLLWSAYFDREWWKRFTPGIVSGGGIHLMETVAENVAAFEVWAWSEERDKYEANYYSLDQGNKMPLWVDLWLEMLSEEESIQLAALWPVDEAAAKAYLHQHTRRYAARVYFPNRLGYSR